jgi:hypothetical protein
MPMGPGAREILAIATPRPPPELSGVGAAAGGRHALSPNRLRSSPVDDCEIEPLSPRRSEIDPMNVIFVLALGGLQQAAGYAAMRPPLQVHRPVGSATRPRFAARMQENQGTKPIAAETNAEAEDGSGGIRQLLGLKGAKEATGEEFLNWKIRLQLTKPATWVPLIWGVACGAAASGNYHAVWNLFGDAPTTDSLGEVGTDTLKALCAMVLAGPFMCGFTQTINDWYDRDLDAINEP